ncbi:hypothetical protein CONLIGDRAFT_648571 [Coniochaeta ligniaria NRRL 30616]|uniref:RING-type domain-containing protein n=1 Tax=Coniochaeta ligniaria NRRL 30616 TaxID=1408157 RepID=A0A1J7I9Q9_9PEZI|nr:hypothetical protein CONLIGDRAFT_648571 [Coniochaeta ligniaria NRRL 30616]
MSSLSNLGGSMRGDLGRTRPLTPENAHTEDSSPTASLDTSPSSLTTTVDTAWKNSTSPPYQRRQCEAASPSSFPGALPSLPSMFPTDERIDRDDGATPQTSATTAPLTVAVHRHEHNANEVETPENDQLTVKKSMDGDSTTMPILSIDEFSAILGENLTLRAVNALLTTEDCPSPPAAKGQAIMLWDESEYPAPNVDSKLTLDKAWEFACWLVDTLKRVSCCGVGLRTCSVCLESKVATDPLRGIRPPPCWLRDNMFLWIIGDFAPSPSCCRSVICNGCFFEGVARNINPGFIQDLNMAGPWIRCPSKTCSQRMSIRDEARLKRFADHGSMLQERGAIEFRNALALREQMLHIQPPFSAEVLKMSTFVYMSLSISRCISKLLDQDLGPKPEVELLPFASKDGSRTLYVPVAMGLFRNRTSPLTIEDNRWSYGRCDICLETYISMPSDAPEQDARFAEVSAYFPDWNLPFRSILLLPDCPSAGRLNVCRICMDELIEEAVRRGEAAAGIGCPGGCGERLTDEDVRRLASPWSLDVYEARPNLLKHQDTTKQCPKCGIFIEKVGGCNHMICGIRSCRHTFCWECLADFRGIHSRNAWYDRRHEFVGSGRTLEEERQVFLVAGFEQWLDEYVYEPYGEPPNPPWLENPPYLLWLENQTHEWMQSEYQDWLSHEDDTTAIPTSNGHHPHCSEHVEFRYNDPGDEDDDDDSNDSDPEDYPTITTENARAIVREALSGLSGR